VSLANLTTSGWVLFAVTLLVDLELVIEVAHAFRFRPSRPVEFDALTPVVLTTWLLWLVTP
jgi:hypothetical protein